MVQAFNGRQAFRYVFVQDPIKLPLTDFLSLFHEDSIGAM
jgi:hypothetical protein